MADKLCFVCDRKLGFMHEPFNNYTLNEEHRESPKGFKDDSLLCRECVDSLPKIKEEVIQRKEPKKESKQNKKLDMGEKPSAAWYLAPILMGIIGSAIMWYVLKDEDHPDSPKMVEKGWVIGIALTLIQIAISVITIVLIPSTFSGL